MSEQEMEERIGLMKKALILGMVGVISFGIGLLYSMNVNAAEPKGTRTRVVTPKKTEIDFEGMAITGELKNPGEFYFQRKQEEKFDSLVKRRKNFHREMLRDVVMTK